VIGLLLAIMFGSLYDNKRLDDFKDLMRAEIDKAKLEMRLEQQASEKRILDAIAEIKAEIRADFQAIDRRLQRLEAPLVRS
jgi:3-dehydroquinate dehydratase